MTPFSSARRIRLTTLLLGAIAMAGLSSAFLFRQYDRVILQPTRATLPADGREHFLLRVQRRYRLPLSPGDLQVYGPGVRMLQADDDALDAVMRAPVNPGEIKAHILWREQNVVVPVSLVADDSDSFSDGTPDFLRLHSAEDQQAFRAWFTTLADLQSTLVPGKLPVEINDCAALLRYSYRETLRKHDEHWLTALPQQSNVALPSIMQYQYPETPLAANLFRVVPGPFRSEDMDNGAFAQFADARTLMLRNTYLIGRDIQIARRGDLIFYRQLERNSPYHSMIVTGQAADWVVYHTGPIGKTKGEIRRLSVKELLLHPDPRWRPVSANSNFLGVYRWNILRDAN